MTEKSQNLRIGIPSKGRLSELATSLLNQAGLHFRRQERTLFALVPDVTLQCIELHLELLVLPLGDRLPAHARDAEHGDDAEKKRRAHRHHHDVDRTDPRVVACRTLELVLKVTKVPLQIADAHLQARVNALVIEGGCCIKYGR